MGCVGKALANRGLLVGGAQKPAAKTIHIPSKTPCRMSKKLDTWGIQNTWLGGKSTGANNLIEIKRGRKRKKKETGEERHGKNAQNTYEKRKKKVSCTANLSQDRRVDTVLNIRG